MSILFAVPFLRVSYDFFHTETPIMALIHTKPSIMAPIVKEKSLFSYTLAYETLENGTWRRELQQNRPKQRTAEKTDCSRELRQRQVGATGNYGKDRSEQ